MKLSSFKAARDRMHHPHNTRTALQAERPLRWKSTTGFEGIFRPQKNLVLLRRRRTNALLFLAYVGGGTSAAHRLRASDPELFHSRVAQSSSNYFSGALFSMYGPRRTTLRTTALTCAFCVSYVPAACNPEICSRSVCTIREQYFP